MTRPRRTRDELMQELFMLTPAQLGDVRAAIVAFADRRLRELEGCTPAAAVSIIDQLDIDVQAIVEKALADLRAAAAPPGRQAGQP